MRIKNIVDFSRKRKQIKTVFDRGMYVGENTSQAASVEFVHRRGKILRAADCQKWRKSPEGFFAKLKPHFDLQNAASFATMKKIMRIMSSGGDRMRYDIMSVLQEKEPTFSKGQKRIARYIMEAYDKALAVCHRVYEQEVKK